MKILLPHMFLRYDRRKHEKLHKLTDIVLVRQEAKKGPRSTMALDRRWFFQVTAELQKMPIETIQPAFEYADSAFVFIYSSLLYFLFLFCISAECSSRFFFFFFFSKFVAGLATKCPVKEKCCSRKGWFNWTIKKDADAHPYSTTFRSQNSLNRPTTCCGDKIEYMVDCAVHILCSPECSLKNRIRNT